MLVITLVFFGMAIGLLYLYLKKKNEYWKSRGLVTPEPWPLLGNYKDFILVKKNLPDTVNEICKQYPKEPIIGAYYGTEPVVIVKDLELLKLVVTKDFYYFNSRDLADHVNKEPFTKNVFSSHGDRWRVLRQNLTPIFTSAKMKKMFYLIQDRTQDFEKLLEKEVESTPTHEVRRFMARYTMDCIGSCILGVETKVMKEKGSDNPFVRISEAIFDFRRHKVMQAVARTIWPNIFYALGMRSFSKDANDFFNKLILGVLSERNYNPSSSRNDFIDFILNFKKNKYIMGDNIKSLKNGSEGNEKVKLEVDDELLVAQAVVFFAAGFETSAATMGFTLYELSKQPEMLKRVQEEIDQFLVKTEGKVIYECVSELPYLEACIDETLRLYPVLGVLTREVVEDYRLPSGLLLEKSTRVHIPVQYLHMRPEYFPEPEEFRPERFLAANKGNIIPYTYYPFGEGPRVCIGMRFAKMQMMAGLVTVLRSYSVELPPHAPLKLDFDPLAFTLQAKQKVELNFLRRTVSNQ